MTNSEIDVEVGANGNFVRTANDCDLTELYAPDTSQRDLEFALNSGKPFILKAGTSGGGPLLFNEDAMTLSSMQQYGNAVCGKPSLVC